MPTYTLNSSGLTNASGKNLLAVNNATGSGRVIRIYRVWATNTQISGVTGGIFFLRLGRASAVATGGTSLSFFQHDNAVSAGSTTPFTGITAVDGTTAITATMGTEFARIARCSDEANAAILTIDELYNVFSLNDLWNSGYGNTNIEPFTIRPNECFLITTDTIGVPGVGATDIFVELTVETT